MSRQHSQDVAETLAERLNFIQIDDQAKQHLRHVRPMIERHLSAALDKFYETVRRTPQVSRLFARESMIAQAKSAQVDHWLNISSGTFDQVFVNKVATIGSTHARIGLEPRWYIGGYALILENLIKSITREAWPVGRFGFRRKFDSNTVGNILSALVKAALLDMDIAISVYLAAAEEAKLRAEAEAIRRERDLVTQSIGGGLLKLAAKDLSCRLTNDLPDA